MPVLCVESVRNPVQAQRSTAVHKAYTDARIHPDSSWTILDSSPIELKGARPESQNSPGEQQAGHPAPYRQLHMTCFAGGRTPLKISSELEWWECLTSKQELAESTGTGQHDNPPIHGPACVSCFSVHEPRFLLGGCPEKI